MKHCCGWACCYFWSRTSPALWIGWLSLWMSLASSVGDAEGKAMTQRAGVAALFTCLEWEKLRDSQNAHQSSLWGGRIFQVADYHPDWKILLNIPLVSVWVIWTVLNPLFHPPPQSISEKSQISQNPKKIFQLPRERQNPAVHRLPLLMKGEGFAISASCSKAQGAAWLHEGMIQCWPLTSHLQPSSRPAGPLPHPFVLTPAFFWGHHDSAQGSKPAWKYSSFSLSPTGLGYWSPPVRLVTALWQGRWWQHVRLFLYTRTY